MEKELKKKFKPNVKGEMDEVKRVSQYLTRHEDFPVSVDQVKKSLKRAEEVTLTDEIWSQLENTESNKIKKGEFDKVLTIANHYNKSNPYKLKMKLVDDTYERPMIVKFGDRYHLVSGNTRLSTAASMGINPKVFIGDLNQNVDNTADIKTINESKEDSWSFSMESVNKIFELKGVFAKNLKYIGITDEEIVRSIMVRYHGGIENVEDMIINDIKNYNGGEPFDMICGGYFLNPKFVHYSTDDIREYDMDLMVTVSLGEYSDVSLFDGTEHMIKDILDRGYDWADEVGYDHSTVDEILMEMEMCVTDHYNNKLELEDKYGIGISQVIIDGITESQLEI